MPALHNVAVWGAIIIEVNVSFAAGQELTTVVGGHQKSSDKMEYTRLENCEGNTFLTRKK
jgi:hypothetical protein